MLIAFKFILIAWRQNWVTLGSGTWERPIPRITFQSCWFNWLPVIHVCDFCIPDSVNCRSQWLCDLRRRCAAARLLRSWVRILRAAWISVCCECCVLSVRGLCDELITRPDESYRLWCVVVCDLETSWMRRAWPTVGLLRQNKQTREWQLNT